MAGFLWTFGVLASLWFLLAGPEPTRTTANTFWRRVQLLDMPSVSGKLARNETCKLLATFLNNVGVALLVAAYATPLIAIVAKAAEPNAEMTSFTSSYLHLIFQRATLIVMGTGISGGILFHIVAANVLRGLED
ncbi:hypothetical protein [Bradyrhizobium sp. 192]|uniref:hypothetical protein n=1 Tax=Bradyrhizobium sp. 192 TaxID=2782660 RepID=UPI001FFE9861|nr:hypothetical protein [Bradyrhizobium sp. 192]UPJ55964.1 hypothetical protein IVB24_25420 [Bradyrhizobium sp. 192]